MRIVIAAFLAGLCLFAAALAEQAGSIEPPTVVEVPAGPFITGSNRAEREAAYRLDEAAYGHSVTRKQRWYDREGEPRTVELPSYFITRTPVTNRQYAQFVAETGHTAPHVNEQEWLSYKLVHPFSRTAKFQWIDRRPPDGREDHPVVLVSYEDATLYATWLSKQTGQTWRLPLEAEWIKAARGTDGRRFPWGNHFDPGLLNSHDAGPFDTVPVGAFPEGQSPFGLLDAAGQVFEWTATSAGDQRHIVKGGSWDDKGCGVCRPAARHGRPDTIKHILIGFRLVRE